jgi:hypothetical protein
MRSTSTRRPIGATTSAPPIAGFGSDRTEAAVADNAPSGATAAADLDGTASVTGANNLIEID